MKNSKQTEKDIYPPQKYYKFDYKLRETTNLREFIEDSSNLISEGRYSTDNGSNNKECFDEPRGPNIDKTNVFISKENFLIEGSFTEKNNHYFKTINNHHSDQKEKPSAKQANDFEFPKKCDFTETRYLLEKEKRNSTSVNNLIDPSMNEINYLGKNYLITKESSTQYSDTNLKAHRYPTDKEEASSIKRIKEFIPRKHDFMTKEYSLDKENTNIVFLNDLTDPSINKINYLMKKYITTKDASTQYSKTNINTDYIKEKTKSESFQHYYRSHIINQGKDIHSPLPVYYAQLIPKANRSRTPSPSLCLSRTEYSSPSKTGIIEGVSRSLRKQKFSLERPMKYETVSDTNCMQKNKDDHFEIGKYFINRLEAKPLTLGKTYSTKSQNSEILSEQQSKSKIQKPIGTIFCGLKQTSDTSQFRTRINHKMKFQNSQTVLNTCASSYNNNFVHKAYSFSSPSDNIQNNLQQRNRRYKAMDMLSERKSESKSNDRSQINGNENKTSPYNVLQNLATTCSNSFLNLLKGYSAQNKISEQKSTPYNEAISYTQYLIQKLSEKNSMVNFQKEGQGNLCNVSRSEEKCTQTCRTVPNKDIKNLIFKEKITQTIK